MKFSIFFVLNLFVINAFAGPTSDALRAVFMREVNEMFNKIKSGVDEWVKIGENAYKPGIDQILKLINDFSVNPVISKLKDDFADQHETTSKEAIAGKELRKVVVDLINTLDTKGNKILTDVRTDPNKDNTQDLTAFAKSLGELYDRAIVEYKNMKDPTRKLREMNATLKFVQGIDAVFRSLYPQNAVARTLYFEADKIVKQIEALLAMDIKALEGSHPPVV